MKVTRNLYLTYSP